MVLLSGVGIYLVLLICTRSTGLRSISKMSSFGFIFTVAIGFLLTSTILTWKPPLLQGAMGLFVFLGIQYIIAKWRSHSSLASKPVDDQALLPMAGTEVIDANPEKSRVADPDLKSELSLASILHPAQVRAVIMETTDAAPVLQVNEDDLISIQPYFQAYVTQIACFAESIRTVDSADCLQYRVPLGAASPSRSPEKPPAGWRVSFNSTRINNQQSHLP